MTDDADNNNPSAAPAGGDANVAQTCCPGCGTAFEVSAVLLASVDTRVRCGECLSIFDALINIRQDSTSTDSDDSNNKNASNHAALIDKDPADPSGANNKTATDATKDQTKIADRSQNDTDNHPGQEGFAGEPASSLDPSTLDATYSDFDLFSNEAELPEVTYFDQTQDPESVLFDRVDGEEILESKATGNDQAGDKKDQAATGSENEESRSVVSESFRSEVKVDYLIDETPSDALKFQYRQPAEQAHNAAADAIDDGNVKNTPSTSGYLENPAELEAAASEPKKIRQPFWRNWILMGLLVVLLLVSLFAYRYRDTLVRNPDIRPWLETVCAAVGCSLEPLVDLDAIRLIERTALSHPDKENVLVIFAAFINEASFEQPYPEMQVRLTDRTGRVVVQFDWAPSQYLDRWEEGMMLKANERFNFTREVDDPGQSATSVELQFR